jgi:hypothetical protein
MLPLGLGQRLTELARGAQEIEWQAQISQAVLVGRRQPAGVDVDLDALKQQAGGGELRVPTLSEADELGPRRPFIELHVLPLGAAD